MIQFCTLTSGAFAHPTRCPSGAQLNCFAEGNLRTLGSWYLALDLQAPGSAPSDGTSSNVLSLIASATPVSRGVLVILALFSITCWAIILFKAWVFRRS